MNFQQQVLAVVVGVGIALSLPAKVFALDAREISGIARDITVKVIQAKTGNNGSGVIIERQNNIYSLVTNYHVAGEEGVYRVQTPDGIKHPVKTKQELPGLDLMVLTFESPEEYAIAELGNSDEVVPLQTIFVAGFPAIQNDLDLVSGQVRSIRQDIMINPEEAQGYALVYSNQTLPGSSGGAVVDENGLLVGINGESEIDPTTGRDISRGIPINIYLAAIAELSQKTEIAVAEQERIAEEKRQAAEAVRQKTAEAEEKRLAEEAIAEAEAEPAETDEGDLAYNTPPDQFPTQYLLGIDVEAHQDQVSAVVLSADQTKVITAGWDNTIKVWNAQTGQLEKTLVGHKSLVNSIAISNDGTTLVSASDDTTLKVWNLQTGESIQTLTGHNDVVNSVVITADGKTAISASDDETIRIWNLATGKSELTLTGHEDWVNSVAVSADGQTIVSGSSDETVRVWDLGSGTLERTLEGHEDVVNSVAISPDGRTIVSGSDDETVKVWQWQTFELKHTFASDSGWVNTVAISADGQKVISGSDDALIRIWSLATYEPLAVLEGHEEMVSDVDLNLDGSTIVSVSSDQTAKIWQLQN
jgi:Trypsin-like peptidase domain/WD domain, G-beta repeat